MAAAGPEALFLHCLPAERGVETTDAVVEGQAERGLSGSREPHARAEWRAAPLHGPGGMLGDGPNDVVIPSSQGDMWPI